METPVLTDPKIYPSDEVISSHLSKSYPSFQSLFEFNHSSYPEFEEKWKYYNDGKSWLMNVSKKKKTLFWLRVCNEFFRVSFYFPSKVESEILESDLSAALKEQYSESSGKKFRAITLIIKAKKDIKEYQKLLEIKLSNL